MKKFYILKYEYEGKNHERVVRPAENLLDVIESLLMAGAKITGYIIIPVN
jgi:hypothetical protein